MTTDNCSSIYCSAKSYKGSWTEWAEKNGL